MEISLNSFSCVHTVVLSYVCARSLKRSGDPGVRSGVTGAGEDGQAFEVMLPAACVRGRGRRVWQIAVREAQQGTVIVRHQLKGDRRRTGRNRCLLLFPS